MNALPTPTIDDRTFDFGMSPAAGVRSPDVKRLAGESIGLQRSASATHLPLSPPTRTTSILPAAPIPNAEMESLKKQFKNAESRIETMSKELAELKQGKVDMEAELENLSQALFEEANKMVSDERKKRAEVEESLKEVKEEREALRQTIKVLGGQVLEKEEIAPPVVTVTEEPDLPDEFMPRDLDKHYEALRKSIHHVAEGASHPFAPLVRAPEDLGVPTTIEEDSPGTTSGEISPPKRSSVIAPLDPNPWANPSPFTTDAPGYMPGGLPGEDKLREGTAPDVVGTKSSDGDIDRLIERLQTDLKE